VFHPGIFLFFLWIIFFSPGSGDSFERRKALPILPPSASHPVFAPEGEPGFCLIQYDDDSVAYYFDNFGPQDGIAVYMDPGACGFDSTYPFKLTNVHLHLYDPGSFIWPVEIRVNLREAPAPEDSIQEPGNVFFYKTFTIPQDSAYHPETHSHPMNLSLDTVVCVYQPFCLEMVYTGGTEKPYPSVVMTDTLDRPDTSTSWLLWKGGYYEWYEAWYNPIPGRAIFRLTGYPQAIDCNICWRWMPRTTKAPAGMPDFDQYQFGSDSVALCAPAAVANCLVWMDALPSISDPDSLIRLLSSYFHTHPSSGGGTLVDSIQSGLDSLFADYSLNLYSAVFQNPGFPEMADSLQKEASIVVLLGLWQNIDDSWYRIGGHYLSLAGVCESYFWVAVSDPAVDNTEKGERGRILPPHHPHPDDHFLHNTKGFVSHDVYISDTISIEPDTGLWRLKDYPWLSQFEGQNFQPGQQPFARPYDSTKSLYAVVEYAIMILQKPSRVAEEEMETPEHFELFPSFPNPFNNQTTIKYSLSKATEVWLVIYNILGQKVRTLVRGRKQNGRVRVVWDGKDDEGRDLSSGIYFYRLKAGEFVQTRKMVLLK